MAQNQMADGFYDMPLLALQHNAKKIVQTISKKAPLKDRLCRGPRKKGKIGQEEMDSFNRVRYFYEHSFLPDWFYDETEEFVKKVQERKRTFLYEKMDNLCDHEGEEMRYSKDQYKVYPCRRGKGFSVICIEMPEPEKALLCYQIYLVFSDDYKHRQYFTVEKVNGSAERVLCSWRLAEGKLSHVNYLEGYEDIEKTERKIAKIFRNEIG